MLTVRTYQYKSTFVKSSRHTGLIVQREHGEEERWPLLQRYKSIPSVDPFVVTPFLGYVVVRNEFPAMK